MMRLDHVARPYNLLVYKMWGTSWAKQASDNIKETNCFELALVDDGKKPFRN
jgi:hypothetical protein